MSSDQQWKDWEPQDGDIRPKVYRFQTRDTSKPDVWTIGAADGIPVDVEDIATYRYQVPS